MWCTATATYIHAMAFEASAEPMNDPRKALGHDDVAAILAIEILSGQRPPASRMPSVEEMATRFGVSRVMTREVTKTLSAKGLVVAKSKVGTHVLPAHQWNWFDKQLLAWRLKIGMDRQFFEHLTQMRRAVEPAAAALAARQCTVELLGEMRSALDAMTQAGLDHHAFGQADLRFHIVIGAGSGNPLFRSFASVVETALGASLALTAPLDVAAIAQTIGKHARIAEASANGDAEAASAAMLAVIDEGASRGLMADL